MPCATIDAVNLFVVKNNNVYIMDGTKISNQSKPLLGIWPSEKITIDKIAEIHNPVFGFLKTSFKMLIK